MLYVATHARRLSRNEAGVINGNNLEKVAIVNELEVRGIDGREKEKERKKRGRRRRKKRNLTVICSIDNNNNNIEGISREKSILLLQKKKNEIKKKIQLRFFFFSFFFFSNHEISHPREEPCALIQLRPRIFRLRNHNNKANVVDGARAYRISGN